MSSQTPFVFQREQPAPIDDRLIAAVERCEAIIPDLEELGALLCLAGKVSDASRLTHAASLLIRELRVCARRKR